MSLRERKEARSLKLQKPTKREREEGMVRMRGRPRKERQESSAEETPFTPPAQGLSSASGGTANSRKLLLSHCDILAASSKYPFCNVNGVPCALIPSESVSAEIPSDKFTKGMLVEISSNEDGFQGAWYTATVIEQLGNGSFLIEHKNLKNEEQREFLREEAKAIHMRPCPPHVEAVDCFRLLEEVDVWCNDGWWTGVISRVLSGEKYIVYFKGFNEEWEYKHSDLRPHLEWIAGRWVSASRVLKTPATSDEIVGESSALNLRDLSSTRILDTEPESFLSLLHDQDAQIRVEGSGTNGKEKDTSFKCTENSSDDIEPAAEPAVATVNGYTVREKFASTLGSIFAKYGDIAKNSSQESTKNRSFQLERICAIYEKLEKGKYAGTSAWEIEYMLVEVEDLESRNLEVWWLRRRLQDVSQAMEKSKECYAMTEKRNKNAKDFEEVQKKIRIAKEEEAAVIAEGLKIDEQLSETKAELHAYRFLQQSMVDGLL